jgi:DNA topoisomerase II
MLKLQGSIEKTVNTKVAGSTYTVTGIIEVVDNTTLRITELPIRRWTQDYKDFLESLAPDPKNKDKVTFIEVVDNLNHLQLCS